MNWAFCELLSEELDSVEKREIFALFPSELQNRLEEFPQRRDTSLKNSSFSLLSPPPFDVSWFFPILQTLSEKDLRLVVSALNPTQMKELAEQLKLLPPLPELSSAAKLFVTSFLWKEVTATCEKDFIPEELLPESPFNSLLEWPKAALHKLLFFLGLHDLSLAMRLVIDKPRIEKIYTTLSSDEALYLKSRMQQIEPIAFGPIDLLAWKGDSQTLRSTIFMRGMNRLAKALYGQDPWFLWHLFRKFSKTESASLEELLKPLDHPGGISLLVAQILELISSMEQT